MCKKVLPKEVIDIEDLKKENKALLEKIAELDTQLNDIKRNR